MSTTDTCPNCLNWYGWGLVHGERKAALSAEAAAELAARKFLALETYEIDARRFARSAAAWIDVTKARAERAAA